MSIFWSAFVLIFFMEIADKSRLAGLLLVTAYRAPWAIFLGMTAGYAVLDGLAVIVGGEAAHFLAGRWMEMGVGILFVGTGVVTFLFSKEHEEGPANFLKKIERFGPFAISFVAIAVSELGDRTQVATAALTAQTQSPWLVYGGCLTALTVLNGLTVWMGEKVTQRFSPRLLHRMAGLLFIFFGGLLLIRSLIKK